MEHTAWSRQSLRPNIFTLPSHITLLVGRYAIAGVSHANSCFCWHHHYLTDTRQQTPHGHVLENYTCKLPGFKTMLMGLSHSFMKATKKIATVAAIAAAS
eukprot:163430-Amphidinium_carterae.6